ncbi:MAG: hypothetical protein SFV15_01255 [Polyangiaceae bacterium]|nr:hypothetical protein [Polyangiaceae bacterium]
MHLPRTHRSLLWGFGVCFMFGCGRTPLDPFAAADEGVESAVPDQSTSAASSPTPTLPPAPVPTPSASAPSPIPCVPEAESCNGLDDDCNGRVDDVPPLACSEGGFQYCVNGQMSDCPRRCEQCLPGSERVCQISYCTYWGVESCAADGKAFSFCKEQRVPRECREVAERFHDSPELEQCCIDNGYCCLDSHDLDKDGDTGEMMGRCEDVMCSASPAKSSL